MSRTSFTTMWPLLLFCISIYGTTVSEVSEPETTCTVQQHATKGGVAWLRFTLSEDPRKFKNFVYINKLSKEHEEGDRVLSCTWNDTAGNHDITVKPGYDFGGIHGKTLTLFVRNATTGIYQALDNPTDSKAAKRQNCTLKVTLSEVSEPETTCTVQQHATKGGDAWLRFTLSEDPREFKNFVYVNKISKEHEEGDRVLSCTWNDTAGNHDITVKPGYDFGGIHGKTLTLFVRNATPGIYQALDNPTDSKAAKRQNCTLKVTRIPGKTPTADIKYVCVISACIILFISVAVIAFTIIKRKEEMAICGNASPPSGWQDSTTWSARNCNQHRPENPSHGNPESIQMLPANSDPYNNHQATPDYSQAVRIPTTSSPGVDGTGYGPQQHTMYSGRTPCQMQMSPPYPSKQQQQQPRAQQQVGHQNQQQTGHDHLSRH
ncbi:uncharacterized protein LOC143298904 isoform X2 [Babylonia areolata]|uniref:uncharacterized protein LOC143298904 isoform X2 n=1 Tax=Babylonia areolata TaxID=304850 RepID=UPI003FD392FA